MFFKHNPRKPHNRWGAYWPGGFTRPLYPGNERKTPLKPEGRRRRERETERVRAILANADVQLLFSSDPHKGSREESKS